MPQPKGATPWNKGLRKVPTERDRLHKAFIEQRRAARRRGIAFLLSFDEWLLIWEQSGHLHERGCHRGEYVMARPGDTGAYEVGNVEIVTCSTNLYDGNIGRVHSLATRQRMSETAQRTERWKNFWR